MKHFTRVYWIFWLGVLPIIYWHSSPDYEFPKYIVLLAGVNLWGVLYLLISKNNFLVLRNLVDKLVVLTGLAATISWLVNGFYINGLIGEGYRYQGLITIWSLIEWYFLSKKMIIVDRSWQYIIKWTGMVLAVLTLFTPLMGNPNFIAAYLVLLSSGGKLEIDKISSGIITWLTNSRSAGVAWIVSLLLNVKKNMILGIIFLGIVLVLIFPKKITSHFDNRIIIWQKSVEVVLKKPILGWGPENFDTAFSSVLKAGDFDLKNVRVDRAHNIVLDTMANTGIVGLLVWVMLFYWLLKTGQKKDKVLLIAFLIISNLNVINLNTWLLFYMIAARISQNYEEKTLL